MLYPTELRGLCLKSIDYATRPLRAFDLGNILGKNLIDTNDQYPA